MAERRESKRIVITATAMITLIDQDTESEAFDGTVINISRGGMGLCAIKPIAPNLDIKVDLKFTDIEGRPCEESIQCRVAWQKEIAPFYIMGVEFSELAQKSPTSILEYLEVHEGGESSNTLSQ